MDFNLSPTTNDLGMIANSDKLKSDKDQKQKNEELDDYLKDDSLSMNLDSPKGEIKFADNNDNKNDEIDQILKNETQSLNGEPPPTINNTIDVSAGGEEDDVFKPPEELDEYQKASDRDKLIMKYNLLRNLATLAAEQNLTLIKNYSINDDYYDIKREYDYHTGIRAKKMFVRKATKWTIGGVGILELLSKHFNFFNINLTGWKDSVEMEKEELVCILNELYDKYHTTGKQSPPEVRLLLLLATSAFSTAFHNYQSKYVSSLFGNQRQMNDIEIDATRQAIIDRNLQEQDLDHNSSINRTDQDIFTQLNDEATNAVEHLKQQRLQTQKINKGNYDIQKKFQDEVLNRGLQDVYKKQGKQQKQQTEQSDMEGPDMSDVPEILSFTINEDAPKPKTKPQFKSKKSNKN